ncbi:MAG: DNA translocase FtsK [Akkermansiaceae bacterium]|nr:DNA translocase FtsK [Akkermansiaceae bacterium]
MVRKSSTRRKTPSRSQTDPTGPYPLHEGIALALAGVALMLFLALVSYTPRDLPSWVPFSVTADNKGLLSNFIGPVGAIVAGYCYFLFGAACYLIPAIVAWWGMQVLTGARVFHGRNYVALAALTVSGACLIEYQTLFFEEWPAKYGLPSSAGGFFGFGIGHKVIENLIGTVGAFILMSMIYGVSLIVVTGLHPLRFAKLLKDRAARWWVERRERRLALAAADAMSSEESPRRRKSDFFEDADPDTAPSRRRTSRARKKDAANDDESSQPELPLEPNFPEPKIIDASQPRRKEGEKVERLDPAALFGRKKNAAESASVMGSTGNFDDYELPSLDLLRYADADGTGPTDTGELLDLQRTIIDTLATFGVEVSPGDITKGPTITRYEVYPKPGLRVNRITALEADLARATKAERIHILAPIPGKDTVGIEVANSDKVLVTLREMFEDDSFSKGKSKIPLALGKDVYGRTIVGDLAQMPHLLVAGATGSGKSVCINSIIASLLFRFTPDQLRFIMIDPKVVEMQMYNRLPHMVIPVVTDAKKVLLALRWVINEMERRYAMFAKLGCRNFDSFNSRQKKTADAEEGASPAAKSPARGRKSAANAKASSSAGRADAASAFPNLNPEFDLTGSGEALGLGEALLATHPVKISGDDGEDGGFGFDEDDDVDPDEGFAELPAVAPRTIKPLPPEMMGGSIGEEEVPDHLPYIVVIIDELADLMQTAPADVETAIARIAQKARAAGIHLIVATQTPRADVVTGIIKANIPSRIAFQVASKIDSRVILDAPGADRLVGKGDMLYLPPGSAQLVRAQGALISDEEIQHVVDRCAAQGDPQFEAEIHDTLDGDGDGDDDEISEADEEMLEKCLEVVLQEKKASTSLLQRRLRLGYTRAARMMDILEMRGIIGPGDGAKPREILVDLSAEYE